VNRRGRLDWLLRNTRDYDPLIISLIAIIAVIVGILYFFQFPPYPLAIPNILHVPIEPIPFDSGWIGFVFILVDGFLLSYILVRDGVDNAERLVLSVGLGFGVTYVAMIFIGILWNLSFTAIILTQASLFTILLFVTFYRRLKPNLNGCLRKNSCIPKFNLIEKIVLFVIGIFAVVSIYQTLAYPSIEWDSLAYGVNYAKIMFQMGKIPLIAGPSIGLEMSASYPPGVQLLAVYLYTFAGNANDFYYRLLQPIFGLATIIITYKFAMTATKNRTVSVFAIFILSVIPIFWEFFIHETYLMGLTLLATLSAFFFLKAYNSNDNDRKKYEIVATVFCSFAALTSYMGIFCFGLLLLYSIKRRVSAKRFTWLAILASFIVMPWYIRNFLLLGNLIYPFLGIGNYLDPMLLSSTMQHFETWSQVPFLDWISISCKIGAVILFLAVVGLTFDKRKKLVLVFSCYLLFVGVLIMAVHIPFIRYLLIALPALAIIISANTKSLLASPTLVERTTAIILISMILISSLATLPCINSFKPTSKSGDDKWSYLSHVFEEGDAWKWINENTPTNARIATYDIKQYYIERNVVSLDGSEAALLYKMDTVGECIDFLEERNVTYILSVPWASPPSNQLPPAYKWCVLTRYLGDPRYLPPVYVGLSGTAVYHVGPLEEESAYAYFAQEDLVPPIKQLKINVTVTNSTSPSIGRFYIPIPVDYREGLMRASVNSSKHLVSAELWTGTIPETVTKPSRPFELWKQWPIPSANTSGVENPSFVWQIDKAGYFTLMIVDQEETFKESFNVTVDIRFYNYWSKQSLFVSEDSQIYNITTFNETFPLLKTLYIQTNEPASLSIYSTSANKNISLEIFNDFIPNNALINWSTQYTMVTRQPNLNNESGEVDPSIQNLFLLSGRRYSILVVYRDSYTEKVDISLEVEFTSWNGS
jgi:hypothetical protein